MTGQTASGARDTSAVAPAEIDPAHAAFLVDRLTEEIDAAGTHPRPSGEHGLATMVELRATIASGQRPDQMSVDMLTVAYSNHPDFSTSWNRWRRA